MTTPLGYLLETSWGSLETRFLINCAGLQSDRVARLGGMEPKAMIVPFRGEYFELKPERRHLVRHLIYPVANPVFPFLGRTLHPRHGRKHSRRAQRRVEHEA